MTIPMTLKPTIKDIVYWLVILAILFVFFKQCKGWEKRCNDRIESVRIDTVVSYKYGEFAINKPTGRKATKKDIDSFKLDPVTIIDTALVNIYEDTAYQSGVGLQARHMVEGKLLKSEYKITYPERTITQTSVVKSARNQVFFTGNLKLGPLPDFAPGLTIISDKYLFRYEYNIVSKTHSIGIGYKLISW